jgi:hypothetical protein
MAEKSIRIADALSGLRMAVRDAIQTDDSANARVIERVDFASAKFTSPIGNATRGHSSMATAVDTFDLTALPTDLTDNLIVVGDKSMLCVTVEQTVSGGTVTITPIVYDNESTPGIVGLLPPKTFTQPYAFRRGSSSGNYVLPIIAWDVVGAYKIGLHFSAFTGTSNNFKAWGWVL